MKSFAAACFIDLEHANSSIRWMPHALRLMDAILLRNETPWPKPSIRVQDSTAFGKLA